MVAKGGRARCCGRRRCLLLLLSGAHCFAGSLVLLPLGGCPCLRAEDLALEGGPQVPQLGADEAVELVVVVRGVVVVVVEAVLLLLRPPLAAVAASSSSSSLLLPSARGSLLFLLLFGLLVLGPGAGGGGGSGGGGRRRGGGGGGSSPPSSSSSGEGGERVPLRGEDAARPRRYLGHILRERPTQTPRGGGRQATRGDRRRPHGPEAGGWGGR